MFFPEEGAMMPQPKPRGGMFAGGNVQQALMAAVAGFMARRNPQLANSMLTMMHLRQKDAQDEQDYQRKRKDTMADWMQQQEWKLGHDKPDYGEFERALMASGVQPGTPGWADAMRRRANNMLDPIVMLPQGPVPRSLIVGNPGPPTQPVGSLTPIPDDGGPTPPASGGFPGY